MSFPSHFRGTIHTVSISGAVFGFRSGNSNICSSFPLLHMHFNIYIKTEKMLWIRSNGSDFCLHPLLFWLEVFCLGWGFLFFYFLLLFHFSYLLSSISSTGSPGKFHDATYSRFCGWLIVVVL